MLSSFFGLATNTLNVSDAMKKFCYEFVSVKMLELVNSGKITRIRRGYTLLITEATLSEPGRA